MPRPVKGILGSATIGDPLDIGIAAFQFLMLDSVHAIASTDISLQFLTLSMDARQVSKTTIPGVAANPSKSVGSRQGTAAAFYFTDPQQVQVVSGLPNAPRSAGVFQVAHVDNGRRCALAEAGTEERVQRQCGAWFLRQRGRGDGGSRRMDQHRQGAGIHQPGEGTTKRMTADERGESSSK